MSTKNLVEVEIPLDPTCLYYLYAIIQRVVIITSQVTLFYDRSSLRMFGFLQETV